MMSFYRTHTHILVSKVDNALCAKESQIYLGLVRERHLILILFDYTMLKKKLF